MRPHGDTGSGPRGRPDRTPRRHPDCLLRLLPGRVLTGNFTVTLPVPVTNKLASGNITTDAVISADVGSGLVPLPATAQVNFNIDRIQRNQPHGSGLRRTVAPAVEHPGCGDAVHIDSVSAINAQLFLNGFRSRSTRRRSSRPSRNAGSSLSIYNRGVITCVGSPTPGACSLPELFSAGTFFVSSRVTEGFATAFLPRSAGEDNGTRFLLQFSGFPAGTRDFCAGLCRRFERGRADRGRRPGRSPIRRGVGPRQREPAARACDRRRQRGRGRDVLVSDRCRSHRA